MEKKNLWIWIVVILLVVVGLVFWATKSSAPAGVAVNENANTSVEPASTQDLSPIPGAKVAPATIAYADALIKYADRRIQLDKVCQASPSNVTYKDNTGIMIDNRSAMTRTVKVGTTFTIKPYGFKIVVLPDTYLKAKTLLVDCDKSQNVATVLVQE